ncbi:hypothetical protein LOTGIDRAFT_176731, partial [Lottia gigantea]
TLSVSEEVRQALHEHGPVVALESTIITHGMPYPHNIKTGLEVEDIIRKNGCIPATIGVLDGRVHVGLDKTQLEQLGSKGKDLVKISRRDFPYVLAKETQGVCVATFGQDKDFPAFFVPSSGLKAPYNIRDEIEAAEMIYNGQNKMKLDSGILIGVPLPDSYNEYGQQIETAIDTALHEV